MSPGTASSKSRNKIGIVNMAECDEAVAGSDKKPEAQEIKICFQKVGVPERKSEAINVTECTRQLEHMDYSKDTLEVAQLPTSRPQRRRQRNHPQAHDELVLLAMRNAQSRAREAAQRLQWWWICTPWTKAAWTKALCLTMHPRSHGPGPGSPAFQVSGRQGTQLARPLAVLLHQAVEGGEPPVVGSLQQLVWLGTPQAQRCFKKAT